MTLQINEAMNKINGLIENKDDDTLNEKPGDLLENIGNTLSFVR